MKVFGRYKKINALFLLLLLFIQTIFPVFSYALTSGPSQPEMKGFEPIGNSDMVDLFSGDFSYNIPLLDVGGYPVNLSYHSGAGMDDEASWVGYGWSLNPGSVNRQLRGLPDDFNGKDKVERQMNMKDHVTKGANLSVDLDFLGHPTKKLKPTGRVKRKLNKFKLAAPTIGLGVKFDNYRGVGMSIGANGGLSLSDAAADDKTGTQTPLFDSTSKASLGNLGINLSSFDGASVPINVNLIRKNIGLNDVDMSKSLGFSYNTRAGLQGMTLSTSFSSSKVTKTEGVEDKLKRVNIAQSASSYISFNGDTYSPTVDMPTKTNSFTFNLHLGPEAFIFYLGLGVTGFYTKQSLVSKNRILPAYGYLNSEKGKDDKDALMDFNREKDIPYSDAINYLPVPVPTNDLFVATSQDGVGQYRAYRGSSGVLFDYESEGKSNDYQLGIEFGAGVWADVGADLYYQNIVTKTKKWISGNKYLNNGDFQNRNSSDPSYEAAYFKRVGEPIVADNNYYSKMNNGDPLAVNLSNTFIKDDITGGASAENSLRSKYARIGRNQSTPLKRSKREIRNQAFSYLNAVEASNNALEKYIEDYNPDSVVLNNCRTTGIRSMFGRTSGYRKKHHISEVTVTGDDGKRMIYGIPVYNTFQADVSFSVDENLSKRTRGIINYNKGVDNSINNTKGRENYFSRQTTPPYATSYLLTGIISPDYVDKKGDGITDDDLGTAVKFNYSKLPYEYQWRTPYDSANYNEGFLSDSRDDKANYVYGRKEVWNLHSIESKTMLAHFVTEDREDGLGVLNEEGGRNTSNKVKRLKEIRLYSKSDLQQNNNDVSKTTPIKVVHFVYDYSLAKGIPNSINNGGKLTLKQVYFTFGNNGKGLLHPYEFDYDTTNLGYATRFYDRWGNLKDVAQNPNSLNNSEYPYTLKDSGSNAKFQSAWQLNKINLPSGGSIDVTYESDDYAYVQDKRASQMFFLKGVGDVNDTSGLINADNILIDLPSPVTDEKQMISRYFSDNNKVIDNLYFKCLVDLDGLGHKEFVPGYAAIKSISRVNSTTAKITLNKVNSINPIANASWQFLRMNLPKYAFPGSDNYEDNGTDLAKAIKSLVTALGTIKELIYGFESRAKDKGYSDKIDLQKSWVRLYSPTFKKYGGGVRVKRIDINDDWANMAGETGAKTFSYSQLYDYTTNIKDNQGDVINISTGVASYEPMIGNDENSFREPVSYKEKHFLGLDNYYYIEKPFCESLFPAASVGYSKVTVKSIGAGDAVSVNRTGVTVSEFYTSKDYPTKVDWLELDRRKPAFSNIFKLIGAEIFDYVGLSQGYSVELNDMHGKPKSVNISNKTGERISSVEYFYKTVNDASEQKQLKNDVQVVKPDGSIADATIGLDIEMFNDMREQTTKNLGVSSKISGGLGSLFIFPLPFFFPGIGVNYEQRSYRASSAIKIINRFSVLDKVRKMENGSSITTENVLWDSETGDVLLTKTQNDFDDPLYSFNYPAHWAYPGMGQAYKNLGTLLEGFSTNSYGGEVLSSSYLQILSAGDELIDVNTGKKYWIIYSPLQTAQDFKYRVVDKDGNLIILSNATLKIIRSGKRNMASASVGSIVSLKSPVVGNRLNINQLTQVLNATATLYREEWSMPVFNCFNCASGFLKSADGTYCYKDTAAKQVESVRVCQGSTDSRYSNLGTYIYSSYNVDNTITARTPINNTTGTFWINSNSTSGPLIRSGIWICNTDTLGTSKKWYGFSRNFQISGSKNYFIGVGADNRSRISIDGVLIHENKTDDLDNFQIWHIYPIYLSTGSHIITLEGYNRDEASSFGAEIYNNTEAEIRAANDYGKGTGLVDTIFSTRNLIGQSFETGNFTCPAGYTLNTGTNPFGCREIIPVSGQLINPYNAGLLGNWRPKQQLVYHTERQNVVGDVVVKGSTNIRKAGYYASFNPLWTYGGNNSWISQTTDPKWIWSNEVTYFNTKGAEIENRDALNRYNSALFGYLQSLPVAVASNSRYNEIGFDGFEDYNFDLDCNSADDCSQDHFSFKKLINNSSIKLNNTFVHSGKNSLQLSGNVHLSKAVRSNTASQLYSFNFGRYVLGTNELAAGFSPFPGKQYLISMWVKDAAPRNPSTNFSISVNGTSLINNSQSWPIVEGWKRVETVFTLPSSAATFELDINAGGGTAYVDDIRILPFDGQMKTFAYDASSQRLMAEMDENNFATFYEYDDEGILTRVKKETERGIMTIKETRSSYRRKQ
jgi:hypothetical protein